MVKLLKLASCLAIIQILVFYAAWICDIWIYPNCNYSTGGIDCPGRISNIMYELPLLAFVVLPPFIVKLVADRIGSKLEWKKIIITHIVVGSIVFVAGMLYIASTVHMSG